MANPAAVFFSPPPGTKKISRIPPGSQPHPNFPKSIEKAAQPLDRLGGLFYPFITGLSPVLKSPAAAEVLL